MLMPNEPIWSYCHDCGEDNCIAVGSMVVWAVGDFTVSLVIDFLPCFETAQWWSYRPWVWCLVWAMFFPGCLLWWPGYADGCSVSARLLHVCLGPHFVLGTPLHMCSILSDPGCDADTALWCQHTSGYAQFPQTHWDRTERDAGASMTWDCSIHPTGAMPCWCQNALKRDRLTSQSLLNHWGHPHQWSAIQEVRS